MVHHKQRVNLGRLHVGALCTAFSFLFFCEFKIIFKQKALKRLSICLALAMFWHIRMHWLFNPPSNPMR